MKLLLALDNFGRPSGGALKSAQALAAALAAAGHEVVVATREGGARLGGVREVVLPLPSKKLLPGRDLRALAWNRFWRRRLARTLRAEAPGLVLAQGMLFPGTVRAAREEGRPCAVFVHAYAPLCHVSFRRRDPYRDCDDRCPRCLPLRRRLTWPAARAAARGALEALRGATFVVANSRYVQGLLAEKWGVASEVLYPILDLPRFLDAPASEGRDLLFVKPQGIKGAARVEALARALGDRRFLVAGNVSGRLARLANVESLGWVEDMPAAYARAQLLLGPGEWPEPFGRVFAEAAALGVPSVATDVGGVREAAGPGARLLPPEAPVGAWIEAIRALDDAAELERARGEARAHARSLLGEASLDRFLAIARARLELPP